MSKLSIKHLASGEFLKVLKKRQSWENFLKKSYVLKKDFYEKVKFSNFI